MCAPCVGDGFIVASLERADNRCLPLGSLEGLNQGSHLGRCAAIFACDVLTDLIEGHVSEHLLLEAGCVVADPF